MQGVFLLAVVAFAAVCNAQVHPLNDCTKDIDCAPACPGSVGVCSPPQNHCHCHAFGEIPCKTDYDCTNCTVGVGCCHNHDHCHCDEVCGHHHH